MEIKCHVLHFFHCKIMVTDFLGRLGSLSFTLALKMFEVFFPSGLKSLNFLVEGLNVRVVANVIVNVTQVAHFFVNSATNTLILLKLLLFFQSCSLLSCLSLLLLLHFLLVIWIILSLLSCHLLLLLILIGLSLCCLRLRLCWCRSICRIRCCSLLLLVHLLLVLCTLLSLHLWIWCLLRLCHLLFRSRLSSWSSLLPCLRHNWLLLSRTLVLHLLIYLRLLCWRIFSSAIFIPASAHLLNFLKK